VDVMRIERDIVEIVGVVEKGMVYNRDGHGESSKKEKEKGKRLEFWELRRETRY